ENQGKIYLNTSEVRAATGFEGEAVGDHGCDCLGMQGRWITVPKGDSGGFFRNLGSANVLDHRTATTFAAASARLRRFQRIRKKTSAPVNNSVRSSDDREDSGVVFRRKD
ncbi:hypothetical protein U1Q18_044220, partial [Sarracenia purpurea var. burkii]